MYIHCTSMLYRESMYVCCMERIQSMNIHVYNVYGENTEYMFLNER